MEKIKFYLEKYRVYVGISLISVLVLVVSLLIFFNKQETVSASVIINEEPNEKVELEIKENEINKVKVDVKGRVKKEGVYELDSNSRVIDAINMAGGLKDDANTDYINLSKKIKDEMIIIIYSNDDVSKFKEEEKQIIYIEYKCECPDNINDACINSDDTINTNGNNEETKQDDSLISINKGTKEELMKLPGIGESKADNIIKYREEFGEFKNLEDIKNVSGIGDSAYSKIKDYIKL